jgi:hypothetical protein
MATWRHSKTGRELISTQTLGYPWINTENIEVFEVAARTIDAVMADVGDDAELAQAAIDQEKQRPQPRPRLISRLQAVIAAAEEPEAEDE